jgi:thiaminase/transcriptional activator TenA
MLNVDICFCSASVTRPPQFDAWIDMYGGEDFAREVREYIAMVDAACKTVNKQTLKEMEKHFLMSCKLEHMFWDQADATMEWPNILANRKSIIPARYDSIS